MSEKTERPTAKRLEAARREGNTPRSRLLSGAGATVGAVWGALAVAPEAAERFREFARSMLSAQQADTAVALARGARLLAWVAAPSLAGAFAGALGASIASAGLGFYGQRARPKLSRLSPARALGELFSIRRLGESAKAIVAASALGTLGGYVLWHSARALLRAPLAPGAGGLYGALDWMREFLVRGAALVAVLGLGDWLLVRRRRFLDLRMSREEVRREHRDAVGDPLQRARRRALHRHLAQAGPARGVSSATALVVNPTHAAVGLRYAPAESDAPYLVAKGQGADAVALRREAQRHAIPVVRDVPLARSLLPYDVGEPIPEELYRAVAAILVAAQQAMDARSDGQGDAR